MRCGAASMAPTPKQPARFSTRISTVKLLWLAGLALLLCAGACSREQAANNAYVEAPPATKKGNRGRKGKAGARKAAQPRSGGVELAAFAKELEAAVLAGDIEFVRQRFVDAQRLGNCEVKRIKKGQQVSFAEIREFLNERQVTLTNTFAATGGNVLAVVHKVRPRKRFMGGRMSGEDCPVDARGRVNVVVGPPSAPPDVVENKFEALFLDGQWMIFAYLRTEQDCSTMTAKESYGCRVLESGGE